MFLVLSRYIVWSARLTGAPQSFPMEDDVDLGLLLDEIVDDVSPEATVLGRRIAVERPLSLTLHGNLELLRRAIENVLRNAIRYSPDNTEVTVSAREERDSLVIDIRDRGPGVPEIDLERIFDPFYRVSRARERECGGTGLGLAITARVASLHAGQVSAHNAPDGGLVVTISFPPVVVPNTEIVSLSETVSQPRVVVSALDSPN